MQDRIADTSQNLSQPSLQLTLTIFDGLLVSMLRFKVPFDEADGEGIVFFGNYFRLAHRAFESYLPTVGIRWEEWFDHPDWGVPLRHVEADYLKPLKPGDEYEVAIQVEEMGESSVHFSYEFTCQGAVVARLKTSHVFVSRPDMKKIPLPPTLADRLNKVR